MESSVKLHAALLTLWSVCVCVSLPTACWRQMLAWQEVAMEFLAERFFFLFPSESLYFKAVCERLATP
jgi:hypothetical protein